MSEIFDISIENLKGIVKDYLKNTEVGDYITSYKCESEYIRQIYSADRLLNIDVTFKFKNKPSSNFEKVLKLGFNEVAEYAK